MSLYITTLYSFGVFLLLFIGLLSLWKNFHSPVNRTIFLFSLSSALYIIVLYLGYHFALLENLTLSTFFIRLTFPFGLFLTFLLCVFSYYYPRKTFFYPKFSEYSFIFLTILMAYISAFTPLVYESEIVVGKEIEDVHGPLHSVFILQYLFNCFLAIWISSKKVLNTSGIEKIQILISLFGILFVVLGGLLFHTILPIFDIYLLQQEASLFTLFFVAIVFYSMQKYRFFNISNLSLNFLRFIIIFFIFLFIIFLTHFLLLSFWPELPIFGVSLMSASIGFIVFKFLEDIFPELKTQSLQELQAALTKFKTRLYSCENYETLQNIFDNIFVLRLRISFAKAFVIREKEQKLHVPVFSKNELTSELEKMKHDVFLFDEIDSLSCLEEKKEKIKKIMKDIDVALIVPLFYEEKMIGFFALGQKENNVPYTQEEIEEILGVKESLEITFMNILLKANLQKENNLMKEIIKEKTQRLQEQFEEMKQLLKQQSDFIAVTSHEFRTPLSIAMFQLEDTLDSHSLPSTALKDMENISSSLTNLKNLTEKLFSIQQFDLSKVSLSLQKIKVYNYFEKLFKEFTPLMRQKGIDFSFQATVPKNSEIEGDKEHLCQVFSNILNNAYKFTPEKGKITLELKEDKKNVSICISDSGEGIPNEEKKHIFDKFRTSQFSMGMGLGLGLYLCRKIIEMHKGKIWAEDSDFGGAQIHVLLRK